MKIIYLYIYVIILSIIVIQSIRKKRSTAYILIWGAYLASGIICLLDCSFQNVLIGGGWHQREWYNLSDTTLWGYLLIIICSYIAFTPFKYYKAGKFINHYGESRGDGFLLKLVAFIFLLFFFLYFISSFGIIRGAFSVNNYADIRNELYDNEFHGSRVVMSTNAIGDISYKICWNIRLLAVFAGFMLIKFKKKKLGILTLLCNFFFVYVYSSLNAARGSLFIYAICVFIIALPIIKGLPKRYKRGIVILFLAAISVMTIYILNVTADRTENLSIGGLAVLQNAFFYLGHAPIIFSKLTGSLTGFGWGHIVIGRLLTHYFGFPYVSYMDKIGYPTALNYLFYTYLGPIYMDFGSLGCIAFFGVWSLIMTRIIKKKRIRLSTFYLFSYYLYFFISGVFVVGILEFASTITYTLLWAVFVLLENTYYKHIA